MQFSVSRVPANGKGVHVTEEGFVQMETLYDGLGQHFGKNRNSVIKGEYIFEVFLILSWLAIKKCWASLLTLCFI